VPRPEISDWEPQELDDFKIVRHLYPEECLDAIIAHLGEFSSVDEKRKAQRRIIHIALVLHRRFNQSWLNQSMQPTLGQQCKALKTLFSDLTDTLSCWSAFDLRSKQRIEEVANNESQQNHEDQYSGGRERVTRSIRAMEDMWRWAEIALQIVDVEIKKESISLKKKGRPEERAALDDLEKIWLPSQAQKKTARSFREFAEAALGPVLRENKRNESLESLVRSNPFKRKNANTGT
jgi:hypothetical protein